MTGEDASELRKVRAASYGAALGVALIALLAASFPVWSRTSFEIMPAAHAVIVIEAPRLLHALEVQQEMSPHAPAHVRSTTNANDGPAPRLWTYSATGQIVFDWPEQYERCRLARVRGASEADCPDPDETRELVLRNDARPTFNLRGIILASSE